VRAGAPPRGITVSLRGQVPAFQETLSGLRTGLLLSIVVILLLLAANFQSLRLAFVVVSTVPAVLMGVILILAATRTTLNVQSSMGAIMAIGVAVANAILLVTFAEQARRRGGSPLDTAIDATECLDFSVAYRVPMSARDVIGLAAFDTAIHTWDVCRATGSDEQLDDALVEYALGFMDWLRSEPRLSAYFPPPKDELPPGVSSQARLLHLAGRDP